MSSGVKNKTCPNNKLAYKLNVLQKISPINLLPEKETLNSDSKKPAKNHWA